MSFYLTLAANSLFFFAILILAWLAYSAWVFSRYSFYIAFYIFLILACIVGSLAINRLDLGWQIGLGSALIIIFLAHQLSGRMHLPKANLVNLRYFIYLAILVLLGSGLGLAFYRQKQTVARIGNSIATLDQEKNGIKKTTESATTLLDSLSNNQEFLGYLKEGNYRLLNDFLKKFYVEQRLGFLVVANSQGNVLSRPHYPQQIGDSLFNRLSWATPLESEGASLGGIAFNEEGNPVIVAGKSKTDQGSGFIILLGYNLNQKFLQDISQSISNSESSGLAIAENSGIVNSYSKNNLTQAILNSADLDTHFQTQLSQAQNQQIRLQANQQNYILTSEKLETLIPEQSLYLLALDHEI